MRNLRGCIVIGVVLTLWLSPAIGVPASGGNSAPLPGFGRTCEILMTFPEGPDIESVERAIGLDTSKRRILGKEGDRNLVLRYTRSDGLVATFGIDFVPASQKIPRDRLVYHQCQVIRLRDRIWIHWRFPDFKQVDYFGLVPGAPKDRLPFDPLAD